MHFGPRRFLVACLAFLLLLAGLRGLTEAYVRGLLPGSPPTTIEKAALHALWRGQRTVTVRITGSIDGPHTPLAVAIHVYSLIIARPTDTATTVVTDGRIWTWQPLDHVRILSRRSPAYWQECPSPPPWLSLSANRYAVPLSTGTARVLGISVTLESFDSQIGFAPGQESLIVGHVCDNGAIIVPSNPQSVFPIDMAGHLARPTHEPASNEYDAGLLALGTIERVERYLESQIKGQR